MLVQMDKYQELAKKIILSEIDRENYAVFLFGSRAAGKTSRSADLDIGILGTEKLPLETLFALRNAVEASLVPYGLDIVDFLVVRL